MMEQTRDNQADCTERLGNICDISGDDSFVVKVAAGLDKCLENTDVRSVLVGVSGGLDSVALLGSLAAVKRANILNIEIYVANLDHGLRSESAEEAVFVRKLADLLGFKCISSKADVSAMSKQASVSLEQAARECRYNFFAETAKNCGCGAVAVAHHRDDQVETVLHRILRGSGIKGISGMKAVRPLGLACTALLIRPMLELSRAEVEKFANRWQLPWREDKSNANSVFTRNRIRNELLVMLREKFNPSVDDAIIRLARNACDACDTLAEIAKNDFAELVLSSGTDNQADIALDAEKISKLPRGRAAELVRLTLETLGADMGKISQDNIFAALAAPGGLGVNLPGNCRARRDGKRLVISADSENFIKPPSEPLALEDTPVIPVNVPGVTQLPNGSQLKVTIAEIEDSQRSDFLAKLKNRPAATAQTMIFQEYMDADKITGKLTLRRRAIGDKFCPLGTRGNKKLKNFFNDMNIPPEDRGDIWLLCDESKITWTAGLRISEKVKITAATSKMLIAEFK